MNAFLDIASVGRNVANARLDPLKDGCVARCGFFECVNFVEQDARNHKSDGADTADDPLERGELSAHAVAEAVKCDPRVRSIVYNGEKHWWFSDREPPGGMRFEEAEGRAPERQPSASNASKGGSEDAAALAYKLMD